MKKLETANKVDLEAYFYFLHDYLLGNQIFFLCKRQLLEQGGLKILDRRSTNQNQSIQGILKINLFQPTEHRAQPFTYFLNFMF